MCCTGLLFYVHCCIVLCCFLFLFVFVFALLNALHHIVFCFCFIDLIDLGWVQVFFLFYIRRVKLRHNILPVAAQGNVLCVLSPWPLHRAQLGGSVADAIKFHHATVRVRAPFAMLGWGAPLSPAPGKRLPHSFHCGICARCKAAASFCSLVCMKQFLSWMKPQEKQCTDNSQRISWYAPSWVHFEWSTIQNELCDVMRHLGMFFDCPRHKCAKSAPPPHCRE